VVVTGGGALRPGIAAAATTIEFSINKSPVERRAANVQEVGDVLASFAFVDQLPRVADLLRP